MAERTCNRCKARLVRGQKKYCSHSCANITTTKARAAIAAAKPWPICTVNDCSKRARSRAAELCPMHYHRLYRYGTLEATMTLVRRGERKPTVEAADLRGVRFGTLTVRVRQGNAWVCECDCGNTRLASIGELRRTGDNNTCGVKANHLSDDVDYVAAHGRVKRLHGSASGHKCVDCGQRAYHWSYDHSDPDERISSSVGVAYSLDTKRYQPRCVPCHKRFDLDHINATKRFAWPA